MINPDAPVTPVLEAAAQAFVEATANPPYLFNLPVDEGRKAVDAAQDGEFPDPAATTEDLVIPGGPSGQVNITIYRPAGSVGVLPVILYTHGAGWVFGDVHTHDRLVRELRSPRRGRGRGVRELPPVPRGEVPHRDRGGLRRARVDHGENGAERDLDPGGWPSRATRSAAT